MQKTGAGKPWDNMQRRQTKNNFTVALCNILIYIYIDIYDQNGRVFAF